MRKNPKIKTEWDLSLLYKNEKDPQIEKDMKSIEKSAQDFARSYRNKNFTSSPRLLAKALRDNDRVLEKLTSPKPWWYFTLRTHLNSADESAIAKATVYEERLTKASNLLTFFPLDIAKIPRNKQKSYLQNKELKPYKYSLDKIFRHAPHYLSEPEEQLSELLASPGYGMWVSGQEKLQTQQTVTFKGQVLPLAEAQARVDTLKKDDRRMLDRKLKEVYQSIAHFSEAELNAVCTYKKIMDEKRGFSKPYSSTMLSYENDEQTIELLINLVTKYFTLSRRFYKLHARLLKEKKIILADRNVAIGEIKKKFPFDASVKIVKKAISSVDMKYGIIFDNFLSRGEIDVHPKKGKHGGAYSWGIAKLPTFVLLNHTDKAHSVETLGHEIGHALHSELSKRQPARYRSYSMSVAETASTFFEQITLDEIEKTLSDKEKLIMLHSRLKGDVTTVFRQAAFFNFEVEMHDLIRKNGMVSKDELAKIMAKHLRSYLGDSVEVSDEDGYFFVALSHVRHFFYVYSYVFGHLVSRALYEKWKEDKSYAKKIERFLSAGGSMSPENIFRSIGIDTSKPAFFEAGLKGIERDITRLEKLSKLK